MAHSDEGGPCCCQFWRWEMYGGMATCLLTERGFTGEQIAEIWDLSDGCGEGENHSHKLMHRNSWLSIPSKRPSEDGACSTNNEGNRI